MFKLGYTSRMQIAGWAAGTSLVSKAERAGCSFLLSAMVVATFDDAMSVFRYQRPHLPALHSARSFGGFYAPIACEWSADSHPHLSVRWHANAKVGGAYKLPLPERSNDPSVTSRLVTQRSSSPVLFRSKQRPVFVAHAFQIGPQLLYQVGIIE
jgi:hypothetical protein